MESADSMTVISLGVVQFNSFEDSGATIKQTVADRIWLLNGVFFVGLRATEPLKVMQCELAKFELYSEVPVKNLEVREGWEQSKTATWILTKVEKVTSE